MKIEVVGIDLEKLKSGQLLMMVDETRVTREGVTMFTNDLQSRGISVLGFWTKGNPSECVKFYSIPKTPKKRKKTKTVNVKSTTRHKWSPITAKDIEDANKKWEKRRL